MPRRGLLFALVSLTALAASASAVSASTTSPPAPAARPTFAALAHQYVASHPDAVDAAREADVLPATSTTTAAPSLTQSTAGGSPAPTVPYSQSVDPSECPAYGVTGTDPKEGNGVDIYQYTYLCGPAVGGISLPAYGPFRLSQVDELELHVDTDGDTTNGYEGADYVVAGGYDPTVQAIVAVVFRSPTADPAAGRPVALAYGLMASPDTLNVVWPSWAMASLTSASINGVIHNTQGNADVLGGGGFLGNSLPPVDDPVNPWGPSRFVPLANPTRLLDTRNGLGAPVGKRAAGSTLRLPVRGTAGIPNDPTVQAVVMNVTAVDATSPGYLQVRPTGSAGVYSNLNTEVPGQIIPNLVVVPVGADGSVSIYTQGGAHLLADVSGYFVSSGATSSGRFQAVPPQRVLDTRAGLGGHGRAAAGTTLPVSLGAMLPADATGVVMNVTTVNAQGWGYVTASPGGSPIPNASNLNVTHAGQTIANLVMVPLGAGGKVNLTTSVGTDLLADLVGYTTGASAPATTSGLFVPINPRRLRDTRAGYPNDVQPLGDMSVEVPVRMRAGIPESGVSAVLLNLTATQAQGAGFVTAFASEDAQPYASNLNVDHVNQTIANAAIAKVGTSWVSLYTSGDAHLVADAFGYFTA